jgi:hypothetical protein
MAITKIPAAGFTGNNFKNIIINGDMQLAQRSTSVAGITSSAYHTVDRWGTAISSLGTWTNSQSTDVPSGQGFANSFKLDCTTADASPAASDNLRVYTKFEGQNLQYLKKGTANAVSLTASFWVKSTKTGTFILELQDVDNARTIAKSYTVDVTNTWEKKTLTFAGDTTGAFGNDNTGDLQVNFWLGAGTDFTSGTLNTTWNSNVNANRAVGQVNLADSTSNEWFITGVQLEAGTSASDFEFLPYDVNYLRCARYCWRPMYEYSAVKYLHSQGGYKDANYVAFHVVPPVPMRTTPSVTEIGNVDIWSQNGFYTGWTWGFIMGIHSGAEWYVSANKTSHGIADANMPYAVINTQANGWLEYNAEL